MAIREVRFSQTAILKLLKDIFGASSPAGSASTTSDSLGIAQRPVNDYIILERWDQIVLQLQRLHLHLFLLTGFDGIEEFSIPNKIRRISSPVITTVEDEDLADLYHIRYEVTSGTHGGATSAGVWNVRPLNTEPVNDISGASLSANQITLPAGTYDIRAVGWAQETDGHRLRLRNTSDTATELSGVNGFAQDSSAVGGIATLFGRFVIASEKIFELQHYSVRTKATNGLGFAISSGEVEVYTDIEIRKIA